MDKEKQTFFDELEADGEAALEEIGAAITHLQKQIVQHGHKRIVQLAKLNALGNIIFQEVLEEIKQIRN